MGLNATSLAFSAPLGGPSPEPQTLALSNLGGDPFVWTASAAVTGGGPNWLTVSPSSGTMPSGLKVSANVAGLAEGTYRGTITVAATGATNSPQVVNVTLTVTAVASILLAPASLGFSTTLGGANPPSQTFQVLNSGSGAMGWAATAATQSGGNWLSVSPATGVAPSTLTVSVNAASLPRGVYSGSITVAALASAQANNSPQLLRVTLAVGVPVVPDNGIVNGASFSKDATLSPGSIASLFGTNLATDTVLATTLPLPTTLGGTQVLVNGNPVPLFFVSPGQINFQAPSDMAPPTATVVVVSNGNAGAPTTMKIDLQAPGIFTAIPGGQGQGAVLNQDYSLNGAKTPAVPGSVVQIFVTGLGATNPPCLTGSPGASSPPFNATTAQPVVLIGGAVAEVLFSAMAPGFVGLYQVNARIPPATAPGDAVSLVIEMGARRSNSVTIAVR